MKFKKYNISGNPVENIPSNEELDPFLENLIKTKKPEDQHNNQNDIKKLVNDYYDNPSNIVEKESTRVLKEKSAMQYAKQKQKRRELAAAKRAAKEVVSEVGEKAGKEVAEKLFKKYAGKAAIAGLTGGLSLAAEAASEGIDSENSGARKDMPDYWLERGIKDKDEQVQRARLSSFKERLSPYSKIPGAYEKPELRKYKEDVLKAEKEGSLRDNYVEDIQEEDDYKKFKDLLGKLR